MMDINGDWLESILSIAIMYVSSKVYTIVL